MRNCFKILGSLALATSLVACAPVSMTSSGGNFPNGGTSGDGTPGTAGTPGTSSTPTNPLDNGATYSGIYNADAQLDFTQPGVLPGLASPALAALADLSTDPGTSLVGFAQAAGIIDLDSTISGVIASAITSEIEQNNIIPPDVQQALTLISDITKITQSTVLDNTMTIHTPSASGAVSVDITVVGASFDFVDINANPQHVVVKTSSANLVKSKSTITATLQPHSNAPIADADLIFNGGTLSIPIGDFLMQALGPLVFQPLGVADLASGLKQLMTTPCANLGVAVNNDVYNLVGISVGDDVGNKICMEAISLAAAEVTKLVGSISIDGVKITNGRATLFDVSPAAPTVDHKSDLIGDGTWTWTFGGADVPATILDGTRIGSTI